MKLPSVLCRKIGITLVIPVHKTLQVQRGSLSITVLIELLFGFLNVFDYHVLSEMFLYPQKMIQPPVQT